MTGDLEITWTIYSSGSADLAVRGSILGEPFSLVRAMPAPDLGWDVVWPVLGRALRDWSEKVPG